MFAVLACISFALALFKVTLDEVNFVTLGLLLVALHLAVPVAIPMPRARGRE